MNETQELLTIEFPARSRFLSLARLNAASMAAAGGFDVEELDDIRLAVGEAIGWLLLDDAAGGKVTIIYEADGGEFCLRASRRGDALPVREPDDLVDAILAAILDSHELGTRPDGERWVELRKERDLVGN
ncbi:MAG: hypothetical protein R2710_17870 [Acidimicrobiales bacterium]